MVNYLRTNYRLTGGKIDSAAIAMGSSNAIAALTAIGAISVAHGMGTTPTVAFATPIGTNTLDTFNRAALKGMGSTYVSFITVSAEIAASQVDSTLVTSALSSGVTLNFVWMALR